MGEQLEIVWNDDHVSKFDFNWLYERNFNRENQKQYLEKNYRPAQKLWSRDQFEMKEFQAKDVFETDEGSVLSLFHAFDFQFI